MPHAVEALRLLSIGFHPIVERPGSKAPLSASWQRQVNRGPEEVRRDFEEAPRGSGIGTVTHGFIVLDLDEGPGVSGISNLLELAKGRGLLPPPFTLQTRTPSGGLHAFYRLPQGEEVGNSAGKLAPGIDVRGTGGQVVLPPTELPAGAYRWEPGAAPGDVTMAELPRPWLALLKSTPPEPKIVPQNPGSERLFRAGDREWAKDRARRYLETVDPAVSGKGGHNQTFRAACRTVELCLDEADALAVLGEWNARCSPPWGEIELRHKLRSALQEVALGARFAEQASPQEIAEADPRRDVAWVEEMQAHVARDPSRGVWALANPMTEAGAVRALRIRGLAPDHARRAIKDMEIVMAAGVECDPDSPPTFQRDGRTVLNTYVPSRVRPAEGPFPVLDEVLSYVTAGDEAGKRWLVNWLAHAYQNPARPMRTAPILCGAQRTGKSLLCRAVAELLGPDNCAAIRNDDLHGRFNGHFVGKLFLTVGEIESSEVASVTSKLKELTGEPRLMAEGKGATPFHVTNRIKLMATSNHLVPVHVEGQADTRWSIFKQLHIPSAEYRARMDYLFDPRDNSWSPAGRTELAALAHALATWPVDALLARSVFHNEARASAVEASRSSVEQFAEAVRGAGSLDSVWLHFVPDHERSSPAYVDMDLADSPDVTGHLALYSTYKAFCKGSGLQPFGNGKFPSELERHAPEWRRARLLSGSRAWVYESIPRDRAARLQWLPLDMRRAQPPPDPSAPVVERARVAIQEAFAGLDDGGEGVSF